MTTPKPIESTSAKPPIAKLRIGLVQASLQVPQLPAGNCTRRDIRVYRA